MAYVRLFAGAAEAIGVTELVVDAGTLGELIERLGTDAGATAGTERAVEIGDILGRCSFLIAGVRRTAPDTPLGQSTSVDVLPPFAGG